MSALSVRRIILLACLILIVISLALALLYTPPASSTVPASQEQETVPLYTVKCYQDYVAVFSGNAELPLRDPNFPASAAGSTGSGRWHCRIFGNRPVCPVGRLRRLMA